MAVQECLLKALNPYTLNPKKAMLCTNHGHGL